MNLPPWWPRTSCVYCGERIAGFRPNQHRQPLHRLLACKEHRFLPALDPLLAPVDNPVDGSVDDSAQDQVYVPPMQAANGEAVQAREGTGSR